MSAIASGYAGMGVESRIPWSALEYSGTEITAISGSAIGGNIDTSDFVHTADMSGYATTGDLDGKLDKTATGDFITSTAGLQPAGNYYSASNPSGFITGVDLTDYATTSYVDSVVSGKADATALTGYQPTGDYAYNSSLSSKLDTSAFSSVSGTFLTAVPEGYATEAYVDSSVSGKQDTLTFGYSGSYISSINGSSIIDSTAGGVDSATVSAIASSYAKSAASGKLDTSAQVVTSLQDAFLQEGTKHVITGINGTDIYANSAWKAYSSYWAARADSANTALTAKSALYDSIGRPLSSLGTGGGGSVTSEYGTIWVSGSNIEGSNSALDVSSRVVPGLNVYGSTSNRTGTPVITNLTSREFSAGNLTGTIKPNVTGQYSIYLYNESGIIATPIWTTSKTDWTQTSYSIDLRVPSASGTTPINAVYVAGPGDYTFTASGFRLSSEDTLLTESAVRELAWKDDVPTTAHPNGFMTESSTLTMVRDLVGPGFLTAQLDASSVSGHDTEFNIIYNPAPTESALTGIPSAHLDTDGSYPDWFLADHDTGDYKDYYYTAGTGIVYNGQTVSAYASGHTFGSNDDKVTARALSGYIHGVPGSGSERGAGYLLEDGLIMTPVVTASSYDGYYWWYDWTASGTGDMTALAGAYTGTATFALSKYMPAPYWDAGLVGDSQVSGWIAYPGSAGSATITQNDVCRVPGDAGDASTPIFISGGSSLPCTGLNWLSALSAWATTQGWTP